MKRRRFAIEKPGCGCCFDGEPVPQKLEEDVKLVEGQKNIQSSVVIPEPIIVFKDPSHPRMPEEEMQRSEKILERMKPGVELTLGDLTGLKEAQRERDLQWIRKPVNQEGDLTVGDLSIVERSDRDLDNLCEGPKASSIQPSTSESQEIVDKQIKVRRETQREVQEIKELLAQAEQKREVRKIARAKGVGSEL